ncbi:oligoribonuclease [candidate division WWE3 bacterium]|uniref:Oligoribonuclease n=1 Tax=candidate division WWE3 bacterium TaxID=2053526 RepID=A0A955EBD0_UNCKA|nr:oligoribonuclease [candidate division WWE3 bacterium]
MISNRDTNLVWVDCEFTGLDARQNKITEIACLVTNKNLDIIAEGPEIIINQPRKAFDTTNPFIIENFLNTGFIDKVVSSSYNEKLAEGEVLDFIKQHVSEKSSPLCGNSVYMDRLFIINYMPLLDSYLHYRLLDVSSIKILAHSWYSELPKFEKKETHRAMDDIRESIEELKYYRSHIFK